MDLSNQWAFGNRGDMQEEAEILAVGFRLGLVDKSEIIAWADGKIAALDEPPIELIDLACLGKAHALDVLGKLRQLSSPRAPLEVVPSVFKHYTRRLRDNPNLGPIVAKGLWDFVAASNYHIPDELDEIRVFDENYRLARSGTYGTEADAYAALLAICERFEHTAEER
jgi:hypothetical protein